MNIKILKALLFIFVISILLPGCAANNQDLNTNNQTKEITDNNISDISDDNNKQKENEFYKNNENRTGGARVGDIGGSNQKVVFTDKQKKLIENTKNKFIQRSYNDEENNIILDYNLFIPENYDENISYPLIMFIPDSSAAGKSSIQVLSEYYGANIWASDEEQNKHNAFVFSPAFSETVVDDGFNTSKQIDIAVKILYDLIDSYNIDKSRIYTTGQSMGCMTSLYLNSIYPDLFAASLFVSGQWDINVLKILENEKFFYVTCSGDTKASGGQTEVMEMFDKDNISYSYIEKLDPNLTDEEKNNKINEILSDKNNANFVRFNGLDHMSSFNYAYDLEAVRDWMFEQSK